MVLTRPDAPTERSTRPQSARPLGGRLSGVTGAALWALPAVALLGAFAAFPAVRSWASTDPPAVLRWWAALSLLGVVVSPLTAALTRHLPDRGVALNRLAGLVVASYVAWIAGSLHLLPYNRTPPVVWIAVLALLAAAVAWASGLSPRRLELGGLARYATGELLFGAILSLYVLVHQHDPRAFLRSGDQGLDIGIPNAVARSAWFPPHDFWAAGHTLNYYYFGYVEHSLLTRLSGLPSGVAYNLAMASVMALTASVVLATGWAITRRFAGGVIAAVLFGLVNNLDLVGQVVSTGRLTGLDFVRGEHLIAETLSAPPVITFTTGELHSHFLSLPLIALIAAVAYAGTTAACPGRSAAERWVAAVVVGLILGAAGPTHFLHAPVAIGLWLCVYAATFMITRQRRLLVDAVVSLGVATVAYLPFYLSYHGTPGSAVVLNRVPTDPVAIMTVFGVFLVPLCLWAALSAWRGAGSWSGRIAWGIEILVAAGIAAAVLAGGVPQSGLAVYAALCLVCLERLLAAVLGRADAGVVYAWAAATTAAAVLVGIEVVTVDAPTITATMRFNVAWKTYLAVWIFFALAAGAAVTRLWVLPQAARWRTLGRAASALCVGLLLLGCFSTLLFGLGRLEGLKNNFGLDGLLYLRIATPEERADGAVIDWLNRNAGDEDVVLEVAGGLQHPYGRISAFTGLTTVLGWYHVANAYQGLPMAEIQARQRDVEAIYTNRDRNRTADLLARYRVRFIVIGAFEEATYKSVDRAGLRQLARPVFEAGGAEVLEVDPSIRADRGG